MLEDQVFNEEKPKRNWTIWLAAGGCLVFLCAVVFVGALIFVGPDIVQRFFPANVQVAEELPRAVTQSNSMGDPHAPVYIVEYGDFQCPYCLKFWEETEPQLIKEYVNTGKVYFEYRSFPILGPESFTAAEGAYCAGDQNKFWEFHDTLFTNWTGENVGDFTQEKLIQYAKALNLNSAKFESCLSEGKYKEKVEQDKAQGDADGVHATPTFFINGLKVEGAQPFEILKKYIEDALNGKLNTENG
ncbi:MAG: DsbA family protein [Anaerolineales bacterium]|nr:DsbA family protein [Anaerolineales bacterium]